MTGPGARQRAGTTGPGAKTPCRLAVLARDRLDSDALLGVATEQISRLHAYTAQAADAGAGTAGA